MGSMETHVPWEYHPSLNHTVDGKYKGVDVREENYKIDEETWNEIGHETAAAVKDIPAAFVWRLTDISADRGT
jgi:hypothetical protein